MAWPRDMSLPLFWFQRLFNNATQLACQIASNCHTWRRRLPQSTWRLRTWHFNPPKRSKTIQRGQRGTLTSSQPDLQAVNVQQLLRRQTGQHTWPRTTEKVVKLIRKGYGYDSISAHAIVMASFQGRTAGCFEQGSERPKKSGWLKDLAIRNFLTGPPENLPEALGSFHTIRLASIQYSAI